MAGHADTIEFRKATPRDAVAIGGLHVASWRETYAGLLPGELLDALSAEARAAMWSEVLSDPVTYAGTAVFVADSAGTIVGFGACGGQRDAVLARRGFHAEVGAFYILRSHQRQGLGRSLMNLMARHLLGHGWTAATLWVLRENGPARQFYEKLGGAIIGEREENQFGVSLSEVAYGWTDLSSVVRQ